MGGSAGLHDHEPQDKEQRGRINRSTRPQQLRVPTCLEKATTTLPRRDSGLHERVGPFQCVFRTPLPWYRPLRRRYHHCSVLSASTVPLIAEGTFPVRVVPLLTASAPRSKSLLRSVASFLLANYPTFGLPLMSLLPWALLPVTLTHCA